MYKHFMYILAHIHIQDIHFMYILAQVQHTSTTHNTQVHSRITLGSVTEELIQHFMENINVKYVRILMCPLQIKISFSGT